MRLSLILLFLVERLALWVGRQPTVAHAGDFCTFPRDTGSCVESLQRFFFNATSRKCEPFIFRGCKGNLNLIITKEECEHNCGMIERAGSCPPSPSGLAIECLASCWHDGNCPEDQKCCSYGCSLRCTAPIKDICRLPPERGPCDLSISSWFYNCQGQRCQRFTYGGCLGNTNRFQTRQACNRQCARPRASGRPNDPRRAGVLQC